MKINIVNSLFACSLLSLSGCMGSMPTMGNGQGSMVTGAAAGGANQNANAQLTRCDETLGTMSVFEDTSQPWWSAYQHHAPMLGSTIPVIRLMIQQSGCFVVVERGAAMDAINKEREIRESGEMRDGSNFGKKQMVAADYTLKPSVQFAAKGTGGLGGIAGALGGSIAGTIVGGLKANEAATSMLLIDNRSGVQISASTGSAKNFDFNLGGGLFGGSAGVGLGAFSNTPKGKVVIAAFADSFNQMVGALKNYQIQNVRGGLGTGGHLKVGQ